MTLLENSNNFTIVSCNIDTTSEPSVQNKFVKSVIMERGGEQIGIIGYTTKSTPFVSNPGNKLIILQKKKKCFSKYTSIFEL